MKAHIQAFTGDGQKLLAAIKKSIDNKQIGTWSYDSAGDLTHDVPQWINKAWLKPTVNPQGIDFQILVPEGVAQLDPTTRGVYLGRFSEMLVTHFDASLTSIRIVD